MGQDANSHVCDIALKLGLDYLTDTDLAGDYFEDCRLFTEWLIA